MSLTTRNRSVQVNRARWSTSALAISFDVFNNRGTHVRNWCWKKKRARSRSPLAGNRTPQLRDGTHAATTLLRRAACRHVRSAVVSQVRRRRKDTVDAALQSRPFGGRREHATPAARAERLRSMAGARSRAPRLRCARTAAAINSADPTAGASPASFVVLEKSTRSRRSPILDHEPVSTHRQRKR